MKIDTLKDLEAMLKVCRKQGVTAISVDGIALSLGDVPEPKNVKTEEIPTEGGYTDEELMFWSSTDRV